jgi:hypothetical protein
MSTDQTFSFKGTPAGAAGRIVFGRGRVGAYLFLRRNKQDPFKTKQELP